MNQQSAVIGKRISRIFPMGDTPVHALREVSITVEPGELVMLLGPSGSGKTTLLHTLSGLEKPDQGDVWVNDVSIYTLNDWKLSKLRSQYFGFVFQSFNLLPTLSALENVQIPLRLLGIKQPVKKATEILARVGLGERTHHKPSQLSGGEQQRVALARALVTRPKIVYADEPTGNLDSQTSLDMMLLLRELVSENQSACLMVTHNSEMTHLAHRVLHMRDGQLVESASRAGVS